MLRRIDRLILRVPQLPSAVRYYRDVLGLKLLREERRVAAFELDGGGELVLHADPDQPMEQTYLLVDDVRELYRRRDELQLKFNGPPTSVAKGFRATVKDPFGNVLRLLDRSAESAGAASVEDAASADALFPGVPVKLAVKRDLLIKLYEQIGRTADDLPYTPHFERLYELYSAAYTGARPTRGDVWRQLLNLRKSARLPKLGEARSSPPDVTDEARLALKEMLGDAIGKRDRLPYTPEFDAIADRFNRQLDRPISPHLVWRLVATLAK